MRAFMRAAVMMSTVFAFWAATASVSPEWASGNGIDFWKFPSAQRELWASEQRIQELDERSRATHQRLILKADITKDLIDGRINLAEATERFTALNEIAPECMTTTRHLYKGSTDAEKVGKQVIAYVNVHLSNNPCKRVELVEKLTNQLTNLKGRK